MEYDLPAIDREIRRAFYRPFTNWTRGEAYRVEHVYKSNIVSPEGETNADRVTIADRKTGQQVEWQ